jgi:3,4-dihydroxy 2-butanone 4-phosphate synthase/GTP cyclohydrolase II
MLGISPIEECVEDIRQGEMVVVIDAADREDEGVIMIAAQFATSQAVNIMAKEGRGLPQRARSDNDPVAYE